ncbi:MAG: Gfo/Idh/MocA family protein [Gaiellaceae bacterium]
MTPLRVGIVGCGEATQIMHLPSLRFLADLFVVTAVRDISPTFAETVGHDWNIPVRVDDPDLLVSRVDVDTVLVATPDAFHAEVALSAIEAGKHVLVEKPLCMTLRELDAIDESQRRTGVVA